MILVRRSEISRIWNIASGSIPLLSVYKSQLQIYEISFQLSKLSFGRQLLVFQLP